MASQGNEEDKETKETSQTKLIKLKRSAKKIGVYHGFYFYQSSSNPKEWYSPDKAGHAGAVAKKYVESGRKIKFIGSVDGDLELMTGKHESARYSEIELSKMNFKK